MTRAYIVTGLGYGDESKGSITDYLARQASTLVVRHNGGPQAGHNVVTSDGKHHTFSQFGAGSLAGAKTFLSRFMLVNPLNMLLEAQHLMELGMPTVMPFVDENAIIVTPFHVAINRLLEQARGDKRHGSCGQGVGVTQQLALTRPEFTIRAKDLRGDKLTGRLDEVRRHLLGSAPWPANEPNQQILADEDMAQYLAGRYLDWTLLANMVPSEYLATLAYQHEQVVFEGAQGVLLDEWYGFHPYTTWSTCTHENALTLIREIDSGGGQTGCETQGRSATSGPNLGGGQATDEPQPRIAAPLDVTRLGVIRAVTTRHGPGPHPTEDADLTAAWDEPHNVTDQWQRGFRVGPLDLVAHRYAAVVCGFLDQVVVTHLDRSNRWKYCDTYETMDRIPLGRRGDLDNQKKLTKKLMEVSAPLHDVTENGLLEAVERELGAPVGIVSRGPTAEHKTILSKVSG